MEPEYAEYEEGTKGEMLPFVRQAMEDAANNDAFLRAMAFISEVATYKARKITSQKMADDANERLVQIKRFMKAVTEERKRRTRPFDQAKKFFTDQEKHILAQLNPTYIAIEARILEWRREQAAKEKAAAALAAQPSEDGRPAVVRPPVAASNVQKTDSGSSHVSIRQDFEVTDKLELIRAVARGEVVDSVLDVNSANLRRLIALGGKPPGVRIFEKEILNVRTSSGGV